MRRWMIGTLVVVVLCGVVGVPQNTQPYVLKQITFENNRAVYASYLRKLIPLEDGQGYDPALVQAAIDTIRDGYQELGFVRVAITPAVTVDYATGSVSVVISISEGKQYAVRSVNALGKDQEELRKELDGYFSLQGGDIYNERLTERFFKLNAPAVLKDVPPRSHIKLETTEEGIVDVTFDFREGRDSP